MDVIYYIFSVTEVETEVVDKLKYIEETKETMDKNTKKLAEIVQDISGIQTGKVLGCFKEAKEITVSSSERV